MFSRIRAFWLAGGGALALAVAVSGVVAAATVMTVLSSPASDPVPQVAAASAAPSFVDLDGNGVDDRCQTAVVADPSAAASAEAAADLDGNGTISTSEAAQSGRIGGKNCNHGGYVSSVARGACDPAAPASSGEPAASGDPAASQDAPASVDPAASAAAGEADACSTDSADPTDAAASDAPPTCTPATPTDPTASGVPAASGDPTAVSSGGPLDTAPNAHGKAVSDVAQSDAVGGKNCNHGGAVSEVAKGPHDKAARDAAKAARDAARLERQAARHARHHGKPAD